MIAVVLLAMVWFLWRKSKGTESKPRDWMTVAALVTWRPLRAAAPFLVLPVGLVVCGRMFGRFGPLVTLAALAGLFVAVPDAHLRAWAHWGRCRAADRLVRAIVECQVQGSTRWLRNPYPMPKRTVVVDGAARHEVELPPGMDRLLFAGYSSRLGSAMDVAEVIVEPHPTRTTGWCVAWVSSELVRARRPLAVVEAPAEECVLQLGDGLRGPVLWHLDDEVGLAVYGAPGAGKGRLARWLALQWLDERHSRRLTIVDLQGSAEWVPLARHPRCTVLRFDPRDPAGSLRDIRVEVERIAVEGAERMDLCALHDVDRWADLPAEVKALHPRSAVLFDEVTNGLSKPATADKSDHAQLIRELGPAIGKLYRTVRKNGWQAIHVDQITYADTTTLPPGSTFMFARWVALGGFDATAREQISGTRIWPDDRAQAGLGVTGRRGAAHIDVLGVASVDRQAVTDTLDLAALPVLDEPSPQDTARA